jgi:hypothetical protein
MQTCVAHASGRFLGFTTMGRSRILAARASDYPNNSMPLIMTMAPAVTP